MVETPVERPAVRGSRWAWGVFLLLLTARLAFTLAYTVPLFHMMTNELGTTALLETGRLAFDERNIGQAFYANMPSLIPWIEIAFLETFDGHLEPFLYTLTTFHTLCFGFGSFFIARRIGGSDWAGTFGFLLASVGWITLSTIGYGFVYYATPVCPGSVFQSVGMVLLALAMHRRWTLAFVGVGLMANFHPVNAVILAGLIGVNRLFDRPLGWRALFRDIGLTALCATPGLYRTALALSNVGGEAVDWTIWWLWMELYKEHHMFPWRTPGKLPTVFAHLGLLAGLIAFCRRRHVAGNDSLRFAIVVAGLAVVATLGTFVSAEWLRHPRLASLMFSRTSVFVVPFTTGLLATTILAMFRESKRCEVPAAGFLLVLCCVPLRHWEWQGTLALTLASTVTVVAAMLPKRAFWSLTSLACAGILAWALRYHAFLPSAISAPQYVWGAATLLATATGLLVILGTDRTRRAAIGFAALLAIGIYGHHVLVWQYSTRWLMNDMGYRDYLAWTEWTRTETDPEAAILVPPMFSKAEVATRRIVLADTGQLGISMYDHDSLELEREALQEIYGISLDDEKDQRRLDELGVVPTLTAGYEELTTERVARLKKYHPGLAYVVEHRQRTPLVLDYPVAYENETYVVYRVDGPPTPLESVWEPVAEWSSAETPEAWAAAGAETTVGVEDDHVKLVSDESQYRYQIILPEFPTEPGAKYKVRFDVALEKGNLGLGVLDTTADAWIGQTDVRGAIAADEHEFVFTAKSAGGKLIVTNQNATPTRSKATLRGLSVHKLTRRPRVAAGTSADVH